MANPTTNYSFAMPTNTDLVKDLPADFDIFGQAVDDRIKALNPETTAGDISYRASTANAKTRLAIGTAGQVLTVNSGATAPEWTTLVSGATFSGASATKSADQSLTSGTWTIVSFNTEQFDVGGYHDNVTNNSRLTIPTGKNGYFLVHGALQWAANSGGVRQIALVKNGTDIIVRQNPASSGTYAASEQFTCIINAVATDYFEINARQDSGGALNLQGGSDACRFSITYLGA